MDFDAFLNKAWEDHAGDAAEVAKRLPEGLRLIGQAEQIPGYVQLAAHVFGEHLGKWQEGVELVERARSLPCFAGSPDAEGSVRSAIATLKLAESDQRAVLEPLSRSERVRVLAVAAAALLGQNQVPRAAAYFADALALAAELGKEDPAQRALAVTANNLASALERKSGRTSEECELMLLAARSARKHWEMAGTWTNVERAEYRLARSYLEAGLPDDALEHARQCIAICRQNSAEPAELFWGFECLARAELARNNEAGFAAALEQAKSHLEQVGESGRSFCVKGFAELEKLGRGET
ncbi:MAG TPA: hypothetical protein VGP93_10880 [Polyangiaceae bacterium]|nr:hypothetical protein [Polyangiaceae bacterium]